MSNLLKAIELAQGKGGCVYVKDGKPCCVIAQLHILEGGSLSEMEEWDNLTVTEVMRDCQPDTLTKYSVSLLSGLQTIWDNNKGTNEEGREEMRRFVKCG